MSFHCQLEGVGKSYAGRSVLDDFNLSIAPGEMVAITGPSGSGKSTVLNIIGLLDGLDAGKLRILGDVAPRPRTRAASRYLRQNLGYLFQNFALIESESVKENLEIALAPRLGKAQGRQRIAEALAHVGLSGAENRKIFTLSGGEQQRVALARLLLKPCDIVLADEPTGSLDPRNRDVVLGLLRTMNVAGKTIIIATHDEVVARACSRIVAMRDGRQWTPSPTVGQGRAGR